MKAYKYILSILCATFGMLSAQEPQVFLQGIEPQFTTVAVDHDADGNTYVLGRSGTQSRLIQYDNAGIRTQTQVLSGLGSAVDMVISENLELLYVANATTVISVPLSNLNATPTSVNPTLSGGVITAIEFVEFNNRLAIGVENYTSGSGVIQYSGASLTNGTGIARGSFTMSLKAVTSDDQGNIYFAGEANSVFGHVGYISKVNTSNTSSGIIFFGSAFGQSNILDEVFDVEYSNGWVNFVALSRDSTRRVVVSRVDTTFSSSDVRVDSAQSLVIQNGSFSNLFNNFDSRITRFDLDSDDEGQLYLSGYLPPGATIVSDSGNTFREVATVAETPFLMKVRDDLSPEWFNAFIDGSNPSYNGEMAVSWDSSNSRAWFAGSYRNGTLSMQQGNDVATRQTLGSDIVDQGFVTVFESNGDITEVVDFTLISDFGGDQITINDTIFGDTMRTFDLIVGSSISIRTPRDIYRWERSDGVVFETDNLVADQTIIDNSQTLFSFINFAVNSSIQESNATTYNFVLQESTAVTLEWTVNFALFVDSDFANTQSRAVNPDGSPFVESLNSGAAGNPQPAVGKHWIERDTPVVLQIDGSVSDNNSLSTGLSIRYIPFGFVSSGAFATQVTNQGVFNRVEPVQQLQEFIMTESSSITYRWKLQYGVDTQSTSTGVNPFLEVEYLRDSDNVRREDVQSNSQGSGVHWYDDGTILRIGAPYQQDLNTGPSVLAGWNNGDGTIFNPTEATLGDTLESALSGSLLNNGFTTYEVDGVDFIGVETALSRPARVIWDYGDRILFKFLTVGEPLTFTADEIAEFDLVVSQEPSLISEESGTSDVATVEDYLWDENAERILPFRPLIYDFNWATNSDLQARVRLTTVWGTPNYNHIAETPGVSLVPAPPEGVDASLIFQEVAFAQADGAVDADSVFTASTPGFTVLEFDRIVPAGRGGVASSVKELRVVETSLWNAELGTTRPAIIGRKLSSSLDLAGLETGYVFFSKALYNPFIYDASRLVGSAITNFDAPAGPIIPVNTLPFTSPLDENEFVVVWYDDPNLNDFLYWPHAAERYSPRWPEDQGEGLGRIIMSSTFGSESVDADGTDQVVGEELTIDSVTFAQTTTFDPSRLEQVSVYNQPIREGAGFNPNEEHALVAPSLRFADVAPRPPAIYALRENDLNITSGGTYTSEPFVLVQYLDTADNEFKMRVFEVEREDLVNYPDGFSVEMVAGEPVIPYYPLGVVSGATLCEATYAREGDATRRVFWRDHRGSAWAVSGEGMFDQYFYYPLLADFSWPDESRSVGDCVAWLPDAGTSLTRRTFAIDYNLPTETPAAQRVNYTTEWPLNPATLKVGETLTFSGGEFATDNPEAPGLPGVVAWAAGEVIFDQLNPDMREGSTDQDGYDFNRYTCRMIPALEQRLVDLSINDYPADLLPAGGRVTVSGGQYFFDELSSSLKRRIFYDPITGELGVKGFLNNKDIGDDTLTAAPSAVFILEPSILTNAERIELASLDSSSEWTSAVRALYEFSRNPNDLSTGRQESAGDYSIGLQPETVINNADLSTSSNTEAAEPFQALGPGLALITNPGFLDPNDDSLPDISYVTLAENNHESLGSAPVTLHIIQVDRRERFRGSISVVLSDNVFDENIILRHTGDFGANADELIFDWWYRVEDGTSALPPNLIPAGTTNPWLFFSDPDGDGGRNFYQLTLSGNPQAPELLLADSLWFVRYRHRNEEPIDPVSWERNPEIPFEWAGAGNSSPNDLDGDGEPDFQAQLAEGWVKRVLDGINPYEARISDFTQESPATYTSIIQQLGQRFEGPVALNPAQDVIENVGLIELYGTVLDRARGLSIDLSTPVSTPGISNALQLASTRLADFYTLLGNEAYADAQDPTIGVGSNSVEYGNLFSTVFSFQNQLDSKLDEELALLRGIFDNRARPVYNRLFWNFTTGEGEAAYATNYNLSDVTGDGFINEDDGLVLYPQGHGDAWGHYLTALRGQYELLNNPFFSWVSRSELYNLQDIVIEVDFLDERKFAQVAAAKAKAGSEIVQLTYREAYVEDPEAQWQGYTDTLPNRAWGVEGWARRAGQGAYFDWITANALIPSEHPNSSFEGIQRVDRSTVTDIQVISAYMNAIQETFDEANNGFNPLGISGNTVTFDIDPSLVASGISHFEQIYDRAVSAVNNAYDILDVANTSSNALRDLQNTEIDFRRSVFEEDMAYRNDLIEIFGSPYAGTIGSGRAYPAGYDGPDTQLFMYVDRQSQEISDTTVPGAAQSLVGDLNSFFSGSTELSDIDDSTLSEYAPSYSINAADWFDNNGDVNYIVTDEGGIELDSDEARVPLTNFDLPIRASGYSFIAPDGEEGFTEDWGERASPGLLQLHISRMVQQEANIAKALSDWDNLIGDIFSQIQSIDAFLDIDNQIGDIIEDQLQSNKVAGRTALGLNTGAAVLELAGGLAQDIATDVIGEAIPDDTPTAGFSISPGDVLGGAQAAVTAIGIGINNGLQLVALGLTTAADAIELENEFENEATEFEVGNLEGELELREKLIELEGMTGDEAILRIEIFRQQEALRELSDEYRALLQRGIRLMDEREAYNKRVAELTQLNRYQDLSFRVSRNASLQRYHDAFDIASRYTYLAAKAYEYETNLHPDDAGSAQGLLASIVAERNIGAVDRNLPEAGSGGLAEALVLLSENYSVLEGQLGLNNPQTETGRFSLRQELFRVPGEGVDSTGIADESWRNRLETAKVDNLWDLPEFRRYCRPFAAFDPNNPEPGIVIPFDSTIQSGQNFFGNELRGGDNSYDPTNFATKISSVGTWFEGYLSDGFNVGPELSETPRIYLIPVGSDVMRYPSDNELGYRMWNVLDQRIPIPFPVLGSSLDDPNWVSLDSLGGTEGEIRRFSSYRAYHDSGFFDESELVFDSRLIGRSVWNTRWMLIIPGRTLNADADAGLDTFINNVSDIRLFFQTYGYSGN